MPIERTTAYALSIVRWASDENWVHVSLRKLFWHVTAGTRSRQVATAGFYAQGMTEREIVEAALRELLRAYVDEIG